MIGSWLVRKSKFDTIFVYATSPIFQTAVAIFIKWIYRKRLVIWVQDLWPDVLEATGTIKNKRLLRLIGKMVGWIYSRCDLILVQSKEFVENIQIWVPSKKIIYLPNPSLLLESGLNFPTIRSKKDFIIVFAGNIGRAQAFDTILEAAKNLRNYKEIKFVIVGAGVDKARAEEIASENALNMVFIGKVEHASINGVLEQSDCVLVSLSAHPIVSKTIPSKIATYMASGKPIIGSLDGAGARIINEAEAGLIGEAENVNVLTENIIKMFKISDKQRKRFGKNGYEYFKKYFEMEIVASRLNQILTKE